MAEQECETCIYTFPYWFWTCKKLKGKIYNIEWKRNSLRIYAPFVMGDLDDIAIYRHSGGDVPALEGVKQSHKFKNIRPPIPFPHLDGDTVTMLHRGKKQTLKKLNDPYPANSIRIDYLSCNASFDGEIFIGHFLEWIRCRTGIFWIGKVLPNTYRVNRLKFKSNAKGEQRSNGEVSINFFTLSGTEKSVCDDVWKTSVKEAIQNNAPPLFESIYHDARFMHFTRDYRRAVLNSAIACEEALKFFARDFHNSIYPSKNFKLNKYFPGTNLPNHLDKHSKDFFGVSLKDDNETLFSSIKQLWTTRHSTAHSGNAIIRDESGNPRIVIDEDSLLFINTASNLIEWLQKVSKSDKLLP